MEIFVFFGHLVNFMLPAFWMATLIVAVHRMLYKRQSQRVSWLRHWLWLFGSGLAVLVLGLLVFQRDGKMVTYVALTLVLGMVQAWFVWRNVSCRQNDEKQSAG